LTAGPRACSRPPPYPDDPVLAFDARLNKRSVLPLTLAGEGLSGKWRSWSWCGRSNLDHLRPKDDPAVCVPPCREDKQATITRYLGTIRGRSSDFLLHHDRVCAHLVFPRNPLRRSLDPPSHPHHSRRALEERIHSNTGILSLGFVISIMGLVSKRSCESLPHYPASPHGLRRGQY
jgi:hypothetical protein